MAAIFVSFHFFHFLEIVLNVDLGVNDFAVEKELRHSHTVLSYGACFVRAYTARGSKRLNGLKVFHEHHLCGHSLGSQGKRDCHGGQEALWHISDDDTDCEDKLIDQIEADPQTVYEKGEAEDESHDRNQLDESINLTT